MRLNRIIGVLVLVIGAILLTVAYNSTNAPLEQLSSTITGRYSNQTMWYLAVGIAVAVGGGLIAVFGSRR